MNPDRPMSRQTPWQRRTIVGALVVCAVLLHFAHFTWKFRTPSSYRSLLAIGETDWGGAGAVARTGIFFKDKAEAWAPLLGAALPVALIALAIWLVLEWRRADNAARGQCANCGHPLRVPGATRCAECGAPIPKAPVA
jgi:hypothetical protein